MECVYQPRKCHCQDLSEKLFLSLYFNPRNIATVRLATLGYGKYHPEAQGAKNQVDSPYNCCFGCYSFLSTTDHTKRQSSSKDRGFFKFLVRRLFPSLLIFIFITRSVDIFLSTRLFFILILVLCHTIIRGSRHRNTLCRKQLLDLG
jgi:hypothetical protein